jgi:tRNA threonylcarbamoyladenosine biosynthesis protein TsaB
MQSLDSFAPFSPRTRLAALDCAGDTVALALTDGTQVVAHTEVAGGAQSSATLLPALQALLGQAGWTLAALDGIAFGQGPGAFTGLRTACAVAQGLAFGLNRPVLAVDSLLLVAEDARAQLGGALLDCTVLVDARMAEVYAAQYAWRDGCWHTVMAPALLRPEALALAHTTGHWAGNGLALLASLPVGAVQPVIDRASALGRLAVAAAQAHAWLDAADALPLYVRDKVAQTTAEREAAAAV